LYIFLEHYFLDTFCRLYTLIPFLNNLLSSNIGFTQFDFCIVSVFKNLVCIGKRDFLFLSYPIWPQHKADCPELLFCVPSLSMLCPAVLVPLSHSILLFSFSSNFLNSPIIRCALQVPYLIFLFNISQPRFCITIIYTNIDVLSSCNGFNPYVK